MSATCCCTELPQKLPRKFRIASLFALSIQPYKIAATASNVVDTFAKCSVLAFFQVEGHTHFMPRMVSVPACTNFHTKEEWWSNHWWSGFHLCGIYRTYGNETFSYSLPRVMWVRCTPTSSAYPNRLNQPDVWLLHQCELRRVGFWIGRLQEDLGQNQGPVITRFEDCGLWVFFLGHALFSLGWHFDVTVCFIIL